MSGIQRYDRTSLSMWPSEDGLYVRYSDHEAEVARLRAEVEALRSVSNAARQVAAWFTSGNNVPVSGVHQMTVSSNSIMADVHVLNEALAAMGASA